MLAETGGLQYAPVLDPAIDDVASPGDLHVFDRGAGLLERARCLPGLGTHVVVDGVETEVVIQSELKPSDIGWRGNLDFGTCGQRQKVAIVGALGDAQKQRSVRNRSRERAEVKEVVERRGQHLKRDAPEGGFQSDGTAVGRRYADRAPGIGALGKRHAAGRDRSARSAGRAARRARRVPGIVGVAPERALAEAGIGELGGHGLPHHDAAGCAQALDDGHIEIRHPVLVDLGAERGSLALGGRQILDRDRHAVERPERLLRHHRPFGLPRLGERLLRIGETEGVERTVHLLNAGETVLHRFDR